ncbi:MAG: GNAT family N-acetyltransferase [Bacteroidetes bacterium]|nr:GNAT family N-acetyltransferase [Bacteroidota bacterium]
MSFYQEIGELVFGSRLKRLSEKFLLDVSKIYSKLDIEFEISWFPLFFLLSKKGSLSVTEIAKDLEITHSAVSQLITILQKKGLIELTNDSEDKRKRFVSFSRKGSEMLLKLEPIWESLNRVFKKMLEKGQSSSYLLDALTEVEEILKKENLCNKVLQDIEISEHGKPEIVSYCKDYEEKYKKLLLDWLLINSDENIDCVKDLSDPARFISEKRGVLLLAIINDDVVGTIITSRKSEDECEIDFILVHENWQHRHIAHSLVKGIINYQIELGTKLITAVVNRNRTNAMTILRDNGFSLGEMISKENNNGVKNTYIKLEHKLR